MAQNRMRFFLNNGTTVNYTSEHTPVSISEEALAKLPPAMQKAYHEGQNRKEDPTISMLKKQLDDPKIPEDMKAKIKDTIEKLEANNTPARRLG